MHRIVGVVAFLMILILPLSFAYLFYDLSSSAVEIKPSSCKFGEAVSDFTKAECWGLGTEADLGVGKHATEVKARLVFFTGYALLVAGLISLMGFSVAAIARVIEGGPVSLVLWAALAVAVIGAVHVIGDRNGHFLGTTIPFLESTLGQEAWPQEDGSAAAAKTVLSVLRDDFVVPLQELIVVSILFFVLALASQAAEHPLSREIPRGAADRQAALDMLWRRMVRTKRLLVLASLTLAVGIGTLRAFFEWPIAKLKALDSDDESLVLAASELSDGLVVFWAAGFVGFLITAYMTTIFFLNWRVTSFQPEGDSQSAKDVIEELQENGLRVAPLEQLQIVLSVLSPLLIGAGGDVVDALFDIGAGARLKREPVVGGSLPNSVSLPVARSLEGASRL